ncbi:hypothetical protein HOK021_63940 [Streptomyces hygroscopicus]|nr:hypothetical protein HOK021_63940 [Streptomyces hygroscopicus]
MLVLRLYEGVAEEQTAAQLGLPAERVHARCLRAVAEMRSHRPGPEPSAAHRPASAPESGPAQDSAPRPATP